MKMRSNQKVEENKPALKFNFTLEYMHPDMKLRNYNSHRALLGLSEKAGDPIY